MWLQYAHSLQTTCWINLIKLNCIVLEQILTKHGWNRFWPNMAQTDFDQTWLKQILTKHGWNRFWPNMAQTDFDQTWLKPFWLNMAQTILTKHGWNRFWPNMAQTDFDQTWLKPFWLNMAQTILTKHGWNISKPFWPNMVETILTKHGWSMLKPFWEKMAETCRFCFDGWMDSLWLYILSNSKISFYKRSLQYARWILTKHDWNMLFCILTTHMDGTWYTYMWL